MESSGMTVNEEYQNQLKEVNLFIPIQEKIHLNWLTAIVIACIIDYSAKF